MTHLSLLRILRISPRCFCWFAACCLALVSSGLNAASVPPGFAETVIAGPGSGGVWKEAVGITFEDNGRIYVWERGGRVWLKDPADSSFTLLIDISEEVANWGDHGFLGFTVDPNFRVNGYVYLLYVVDRYYLLNFGTPGYNPAQSTTDSASIGRLTRYTCRSSDGFRSVDLSSRMVLVGETKQTGIPICTTKPRCRQPRLWPGRHAAGFYWRWRQPLGCRYRRRTNHELCSSSSYGWNPSQQRRRGCLSIAPSGFP